MDTVNLQARAAEYLALAGASASGRHSHTLVGGHGHALRQTLMALKSGQGLAEHAGPDEATIQVLTGHLTLSTAAGTTHLQAGDLGSIPTELHSVEALSDSVFLLTVLVPQSS